MTLPSSTYQRWRPSLPEVRHPMVLPPHYDVVRTGMGLGLPAIEALREQNDAVGPILCCLAHRVLLIPVEAGTANAWRAPHSLCRPGAQWQCADLEYRSFTSCNGRFWIFDTWDSPPTTAAALLHHVLSLTRSRKRSKPALARTCAERRVLEVTHA
ncbi:hypothetical protein [Streptomyces sp. NPDC020681]|uniref:hypothetical protein n=1 Tax=Streptomyces sp. NPDC020681 TaxID=3365083 RepID=UPI0037A81539